jgi:hypothetical protein
MLALATGRGRGQTFLLEVTDAAGEPIDLVSNGRELRFSAKYAIGDPDPPTIFKESGAGITPHADQAGAGRGLADLRLVPADTAAIGDGERAVFLDCQLELVIVAGEPEVVDTGVLGVYPVVRESTA